MTNLFFLCFLRVRESLSVGAKIKMDTLNMLLARALTTVNTTPVTTPPDQFRDLVINKLLHSYSDRGRAAQTLSTSGFLGTWPQ